MQRSGTHQDRRLSLTKRRTVPPFDPGPAASTAISNPSMPDEDLPSWQPLGTWHSWLFSDPDDLRSRSGHYQTPSVEMDSPVMTSVPVLPKLRTLRFSPVIFEADPVERYHSSEEDVSTDDGSDSSSFSSREEEKEEEEEEEEGGGGGEDDVDGDYDRYVTTSASDVDEHVARILSYIAPGKPRMIDVDTFSPVQRRRRPLPDLHVNNKPSEPAVRRRIRERRELDRILQGRTWLAKAFGSEDLYPPRRLPVAVPDDIAREPSSNIRPILQRAQSSLRTLVAPPTPDPSPSAGCDPLGVAVASSKLKGVVQSLMSTTRRAKTLDVLCGG